MVDARSRVVLVLWYMLMVIVIQSYTASLSSILTVESLNPLVVNVDDHYVGYQEGSFVKNLLIQNLKVPESKLRSYKTMQEYDEALTRGNRHDGVAAFYDETPYIKLFLSTYCSKYMIVGPRFRTDGFGFVSPSDSRIPFGHLTLKLTTFCLSVFLLYVCRHFP